MEKGGKIVDLRFVSQMIISSYLREIRTLYLKVFFFRRSVCHLEVGEKRTESTQSSERLCTV